MSSSLDDFPLDVLGQQSLLNIYTQLCFCYPINLDADPTRTIIPTLTAGLERLASSFPWTAGQISNRDGVFKITPLEKTPRLVIKDLRDDVSSPSFTSLRESNFPARFLDESIIAPRKTLTMLEPEAKDLPVFALQVTFISGGLILTFVGHHQAMDMTGQEQVMFLFSKACRGEAFTEDELRIGNASRRDAIPLLDASYTPGPEVAHQIISQPPSAPSGTPPQCTWAYFLFSATSLASLKSLTSSTLPPTCAYITTDDVLSAIIWQHVARSRLPRSLGAVPHATPSKFTRAVDIRRYFPDRISPTYPGLAQNLTHHTFPLQTLAHSSLDELAAHLRAAVDPTTSSLAFSTSAIATVLSRSEDKSESVVSFTGIIDPSIDFMLSSWAKVAAYSLDFGWGLPEAVRRPRFTPVEGLGYLMPKRKDGEVAVMVCLRDEDMERLRADEEFGRYGKYVG